MDAQLHRLEVGAVAGEDHDLAIEHDAFGFDALDRRDELREVSRQWLGVATVNHDLVAVLEGDGTKAIPLWLVLPRLAVRQLGLNLGLHWTEWRHHAQIHAPYTR